jgi:hypothetical protein
MASIDVIQPGTEVAFGDNLRGTVLAVAVRGAKCSIAYQVSYWIGDCRQTVWLTPPEVDTRRKKSVRIGFLAEGTP